MFKALSTKCYKLESNKLFKRNINSPSFLFCLWDPYSFPSQCITICLWFVYKLTVLFVCSNTSDVCIKFHYLQYYSCAFLIQPVIFKQIDNDWSRAILLKFVYFLVDNFYIFRSTFKNQHFNRGEFKFDFTLNLWISLSGKRKNPSKSHKIAVNTSYCPLAAKEKKRKPQSCSETNPLCGMWWCWHLRRSPKVIYSFCGWGSINIIIHDFIMFT